MRKASELIERVRLGEKAEDVIRTPEIQKDTPETPKEEPTKDDSEGAE